MRCIWLKSLFDFLIKTLFKSWLYASAVTFLLLLICIEVFVWFLLVYETLNNRLRLLIISRSYK